MKVVRDIEDGELHLASINEGDLGLCSTLQFLVGVSDSNPGSGVRRVWSWYYVDSEGARLKGSSRFCSSLYAYGILDEGYKFNMSVEEAAELAWRAFITQYSVTELVVAVFLVIC
ncbi:unnamed protein product [Triticum turgidum subsp. durum]|uniref:Uncharacterized protein n=1 Tax=Triticum turgidum subsp. durum TaxID=4567 RepID=A0A9R0QDQ9_TRITD|nr:unnamed protein product [Triticum turgidum subsp. durum]